MGNIWDTAFGYIYCGCINSSFSFRTVTGEEACVSDSMVCGYNPWSRKPCFKTDYEKSFDNIIHTFTIMRIKT